MKKEIKKCFENRQVSRGSDPKPNEWMVIVLKKLLMAVLWDWTTETIRFNLFAPFFTEPKLNWMDAIRKQASKLREQVARQQQVRYRRSFHFFFVLSKSLHLLTVFFTFGTLRCYFPMQFSSNSEQCGYNLVVIVVLVNMIPQSIRSNRISYLHCENQ